MQTGKIKKIIRERGFGFISANDGREVFVHRTAVEGAGFDSLQEGQEVTFEVENSPKGPSARNVRPSA
jgi:CspA family cold shock protein